VGGADAHQGLLNVDAGQAHQRGDEVDVAGGRGDPTVDGRDVESAHKQRYVGGLVERVAPLLLKAAVRAEQVTVVRGEHDDGVVGHA
jgi:hypothetical protein